MTDKTYLRLDDRALLSVSGEDSRVFLQGIISNDIERVAGGAAIYAALLTPQGKYLHDFFVFENGGGLLLDCERARIADLERRLRMYRLRAKVDIEAVENLAIYALTGDGIPEIAGGAVYADPRLSTMGARAALPEGAEATLDAAGFTPCDRAEYEAMRLEHGVPDSGRDLIAEKSYPLECGLDELNGVDFEKGCYVGQEVTARMKHRALVRKRLFPVAIDGPPPEPGTSILLGEIEAGEMCSSLDGHGIALIRLEHLESAERDGTPLWAGGAKLAARRPDWIDI